MAGVRRRQLHAVAQPGRQIRHEVMGIGRAARSEHDAWHQLRIGINDDPEPNRTRARPVPAFGDW